MAKDHLPDETLRKQILIEIRRSTGAEAVKLPTGIRFELKSETLLLTMCKPESIGWGDGAPENMTKDDAAFEAWAVTLYVHYLKCYGKVCLDICESCQPGEPVGILLDKLFKGELSKEEEKRVRCYARFLYRAMRFAREYAWFSLSERLQKLTAPLQAYFRTHDFTNKMPKGKASPKDAELAQITARFMDQDSAQLAMAAWGIKDVPQMYTQLPLDLYKKTDASENRLFPRKGSTVNMWARQGDTLSIFEIGIADSTPKKKVGLLTKLCFLASIAYDLFGSGEPTFTPNVGSKTRGYDELAPGSIRTVDAFLLLDKQICHPLLDQAVFRTMADHKGRPIAPNILYSLLIYETDKDKKVKKVYKG